MENKELIINYKDELCNMWEDNNNIKVKYFSDDTPRLKIEPKGDMIDLYAAEDIMLEYMEEALIPLGVAIEVPIGFRCNLLPRSSTFKKWGIIVTNSMGVIDHLYCGDNDEWKLAVICLKPRHFIDGKKCTLIHKGDKIAQFEVVPIMPKFNLKEVDHLNNKDRGGFGSTGSK